MNNNNQSGGFALPFGMRLGSHPVGGPHLVGSPVSGLAHPLRVVAPVHAAPVAVHARPVVGISGNRLALGVGLVPSRTITKVQNIPPEQFWEKLRKAFEAGQSLADVGNATISITTSSPTTTTPTTGTTPPTTGTTTIKGLLGATFSDNKQITQVLGTALTVAQILDNIAESKPTPTLTSLVEELLKQWNESVEFKLNQKYLKYKTKYLSAKTN